MTQQPVAEEESDFVRDFSMIVRTAMMAGMQLREIGQRREQNRQRQDEMRGREADAGAREEQRKLEKEERRLDDQERQIKREQDKVAESLRRDAYADKFWEKAGNERIVTSLLAAQELSTAGNATAKVAYMEFADRIRDKWGVSVEAFNTHTDKQARREALLDRLGRANPAGRDRDETANRVYQEEKARVEAEQARKQAVPAAEAELAAVHQTGITADEYVSALTKKQVDEMVAAAEHRTEGGASFAEAIEHMHHRLDTVHEVPERYSQLTRLVHDSREHQRIDQNMTAAEYLDLLGDEGRKQLEESADADTWRQFEDDRAEAVEAELASRMLAVDAAEKSGEAAAADVESAAYVDSLSEVDRLHLINEVFPDKLTDEQQSIVSTTEAGNRAEVVAEQQQATAQAIEAAEAMGEHKLANVQSPALYVAALSTDQRQQLVREAQIFQQGEGESADRAYGLRLRGRTAAAERGEPATLSAHDIDRLTPTGQELLDSVSFTGEAEELTTGSPATYIAALTRDEKRDLYADFLTGTQDSDKRRERLEAAQERMTATVSESETAYDKAGQHLAGFMQDSPGAGYGRTQTEYFSNLAPAATPSSDPVADAEHNRQALEDRASQRDASASQARAEAHDEHQEAAQADDAFASRFQAYVAAHPDVPKSEAIQAVLRGETRAEGEALSEREADDIIATKEKAEGQTHTSRAGDAEANAHREETDADRLRSEADQQNTNPMTEASPEQRAAEDEAMEEYYAEKDAQERNNNRDYVPDDTRRDFPGASARRDHQRQNHRKDGPEFKSDTMGTRTRGKARTRQANGQARGRDEARGR